MNSRDSITSGDENERSGPNTTFQPTQPIAPSRPPKGVLNRKIRDPEFRWMVRHPARIIALGFGSGLITPAPGTWGTLAGWIVWLVLLHKAPPGVQVFAVVLAMGIGVWACHRTGLEVGSRDHGAIVWDEIAAIWLVLWLVPPTLLAQLAAFALFRAFDILKPQPIRYFDMRFKNGFGVMADDVVAAFYTLMLFAIWMRIFGG